MKKTWSGVGGWQGAVTGTESGAGAAVNDDGPEDCVGDTSVGNDGEVHVEVVAVEATICAVVTEPAQAPPLSLVRRSDPRPCAS